MFRFHFWDLNSKNYHNKVKWKKSVKNGNELIPLFGTCQIFKDILI